MVSFCIIVIIYKGYFYKQGRHKIMKNKNNIKLTNVIDVEWRINKAGYAVPKIKLEPVKFSKVTVRYCNGYNAKYIRDNNIGPGTVVEIILHGKNSPSINSVVAVAKETDLLKYCPYCNAELKWCGSNLKCCNPNCENLVIKDTLIWTEVLAPVNKLGETTKIKLFTEIYGKVPSIETLMNGKARLYNNPEITDSNRMKKMFKLLFEDTPVQLYDAIKALNIPRFSGPNISKLAEYPDEVHKLVDIAYNGSCADGIEANHLISKLEYRLGKLNTEILTENMDKIARLKLIEKRIIWKSDNEIIPQKKKIAVLGNLSVRRSKFKNEISSAGFVLAELDRDTEYLITNTPESNSYQNKRADNWGVKTITENEFREKFLHNKE